MVDMHKVRVLSGFKGIDIFLLVSVVALCVIGVIFIYSGSGSNNALLVRHLVLLGIGVCAMLGGMAIDHSVWRASYDLIFIACILLLISVFVFGRSDYGAARWIPIGSFQFQPSECMKFALCSFLAVKLSTFKNWRELKVPLIWTIGVFVLIAKQPNFSMMLLCGGMIGLFLLVANFPVKALMIALAVSVTAGLIYGFSADYRKQRFEVFIDPESDADGKGFQSRQMKIAVGNGGLLGQGIGYGTQKNGYIAFSYKDGMFALVAEEGGFKVTAAVLLCFLCILWRGYVIAERARWVHSKYAMFLALGLTAFIVMNALMHIAVCTGRFPTTGQPLPFISYGGTNLIMNMFFVGVLLNISKEHTGRRFKFEEVASDFDPIECEHPTSRFRSV